MAPSQPAGRSGDRRPAATSTSAQVSGVGKSVLRTSGPDARRAEGYPHGGFVDALEKLIRDSGLSLYALEQRTGVRKQKLSAWLNGVNFPQ
jgi:hypothetical protein